MAERTTCPARSGAIDIVFWIASSATCVGACRVGPSMVAASVPATSPPCFFRSRVDHPLDLGAVALGDQAAVDHHVGQRLGLAGRPGRARLGQLALVDEVGIDRHRAEQEVAIGVHAGLRIGGDGTNCPDEPARGRRTDRPGARGVRIVVLATLRGDGRYDRANLPDGVGRVAGGGPSPKVYGRNMPNG